MSGGRCRTKRESEKGRLRFYAKQGKTPRAVGGVHSVLQGWRTKIEPAVCHLRKRKKGLKAGQILEEKREVMGLQPLGKTSRGHPGGGGGWKWGHLMNRPKFK